MDKLDLNKVLEIKDEQLKTKHHTKEDINKARETRRNKKVVKDILKVNKEGKR